MRHQRNAYLFQSIVPPSFKRRDQNQIRVYTHNHLIIEIPFNTYLMNASFFQTIIYFLVKQMACTGDTHHCIQLFQLDKIGKLQGSHADNASYGSFNNCIIRRYVFRFHTSWHQSIMKRLTFFILRVLNVKQTSLIRISYFKPLGIFRNNLHNRRICQCLMFQIPGTLFVLTLAGCNSQ